MPSEIRLEIFGEKVIARRLERFGEGISDFRPLFNRIVTVLEESTVENFATEGHGTWPPLSPRYAAWKAEHYPGKPIMRRTDRLYDSLVGKGAGAVRDIQETRMRYGTTVPYAAIHQKGGATIPQRRVVHLLEERKKAVMKEVQRFVVAASRGEEL